MINGSSPSTRRFVHGDFKIVKVIFANVEFVEYVTNMCTSCATVGLVINGRFGV